MDATFIHEIWQKNGLFSFIKDELLRCRWGALSLESRFYKAGVGKVSKGENTEKA